MKPGVSPRGRLSTPPEYDRNAKEIGERSWDKDKRMSLTHFPRNVEKAVS